MVLTTIKVKEVIADTDAALPVPCLIHGVIGKTTSQSTAATVIVHNSATVAGSVPVVVIAADQGPTAGNYQSTFGVMFPYPIRCYTGVSVDVTNAFAYIYYS